MAGSNQMGPFSTEELKDKNISKTTKVWHQGMDDWLEAQQIAELNELFAITPPPYIPKKSKLDFSPQVPFHKPPKTWLVESILATIFCCLPFGIAGIVFASQVESKFMAGDYEAAEKASSNAKLWTIISFVLGLLVVVPYIIFVIFVGFAGI